MSACFLRFHVCDVIKFRDDHTRIRMNDPLASLACLRGRRIVLISYLQSHLKATFVNFATRFWRRKFKIRNSYPMYRMQHLVNEQLRLLKFDCCLLCFVIFYFRSISSCSASSSVDLTCRGVHILTDILAFVSAPQTTPRTANIYGNYYLALPRSMIVAIEQISFIGWNSCIPRTFLF